ncbi:MAG: sigma-70 family RNA polymerase sigma factor [Dehalococcoidia bacterium]
MKQTLIGEAEAIERARSGDHAAFGSLVEQYQEVAFRAAYLVVRDAPAAEDVAQDAFIRAYRHLASFRRGEPFRPWLLRIVTNTAINEVRSRQRRTGLLGRFAAITPTSTEAPDVSLGDAHASTLARAINELPLDDRVVLHLRYFLDLPEREIAATIGKPAGTVKSRLHRASKRLRELIEQKYPQLAEAIHE